MDWLHLMEVFGPVGACYAAIRADLAVARTKAETAEHNANKAHGRLDDHINLHHVKGA